MMLWVLAAHAGVVVGPSVIRDLPSDSTLAGLDLQILANQERGVRPIARFAGGLDLKNSSPVSMGELGIMGVVPTEDVATIRVGAFARATRIRRDGKVPLQTSSVEEGQPRQGLVPALLVQVEFSWTPEAPFVLGGHAGFGPWGGILFDCAEIDPLPDRCVVWPGSFTGAVYARKTFSNGLHLHASVGVHLSAGIGYAFPGRK